MPTSGAEDDYIQVTTLGRCRIVWRGQLSNGSPSKVAAGKAAVSGLQSGHLQCRFHRSLYSSWKRKRIQCDQGRPVCQKGSLHETRLRWETGIASRGKYTGAQKPVKESTIHLVRCLYMHCERCTRHCRCLQAQTALHTIHSVWITTRNGQYGPYRTRLIGPTVRELVHSRVRNLSHPLCRLQPTSRTLKVFFSFLFSSCLVSFQTTMKWRVIQP